MHRQQALHALGQHQLFLRRHALIKRKADDASRQHHGARDKIRQTPAKKLSATIARSDTMLTISPLT